MSGDVVASRCRGEERLDFGRFFDICTALAKCDRVDHSAYVIDHETKGNQKFLGFLKGQMKIHVEAVDIGQGDTSKSQPSRVAALVGDLISLRRPSAFVFVVQDAIRLSWPIAMILLHTDCRYDLTGPGVVCVTDTSSADLYARVCQHFTDQDDFRPTPCDFQRLVKCLNLNDEMFSDILTINKYDGSIHQQQLLGSPQNAVALVFRTRAESEAVLGAAIDFQKAILDRINMSCQVVSEPPPQWATPLMQSEAHHASKLGDGPGLLFLRVLKSTEFLNALLGAPPKDGLLERRCELEIRRGAVLLGTCVAVRFIFGKLGSRQPATKPVVLEPLDVDVCEGHRIKLDSKYLKMFSVDKSRRRGWVTLKAIDYQGMRTALHTSDLGLRKAHQHQKLELRLRKLIDFGVRKAVASKQLWPRREGWVIVHSGWSNGSSDRLVSEVAELGRLAFHTTVQGREMGADEGLVLDTTCQVHEYLHEQNLRVHLIVFSNDSDVVGSLLRLEKIYGDLVWIEVVGFHHCTTESVRRRMIECDPAQVSDVVPNPPRNSPSPPPVAVAPVPARAVAGVGAHTNVNNSNGARVATDSETVARGPTRITEAAFTDVNHRKRRMRAERKANSKAKNSCPHGRACVYFAEGTCRKYHCKADLDAKKAHMSCKVACPLAVYQTTECCHNNIGCNAKSTCAFWHPGQPMYCSNCRSYGHLTIGCPAPRHSPEN